jgi:hypothetical protein
MPSAFIPRGMRGSWFAEWQGQRYPCVHKRYRTGDRSQWYEDPSAMPGSPKWDELIGAISETKRVIETDDVVRDDDIHRTKKRTGYIGLWEIGEITITPNPEAEGRSHLRFRFVQRLAG